MNYIKHLTGFFEKAAGDFELNPTHISLYLALFQLWNRNRFENPIGVSRDELMHISKIASYATYHKCIRELDERGYIKYLPSHNQFRGTKAEVISLEFYTPPRSAKPVGQSKAGSKFEPQNEPEAEPLLNQPCTPAELLPYINNTNALNPANGRAQDAADPNWLITSEEAVLTEKKLREEKGRAAGAKIPPLWGEVLPFFEEKKMPETEAQKFYNHFQSNGWLVGGKSEMRDWRAAARNWMLNAAAYTAKTQFPQAKHLQTSNFKNYAEPL